MDSTPLVSDIVITKAPRTHLRAGLLAWVSFVVCGVLRLDGITLRRTRAGAKTLSFPTRRDGRGSRHRLVEPVNASARAAIERAVLSALGLARDNAVSPPPFPGEEDDP